MQWSSSPAEHDRLWQRSRSTRLDFKEFLLTIPLNNEAPEQEFDRIPIEPREVDL